MMSERAGAPWLLYILATLCVAALVAAFLVVGPPAQSAASTRTATVGRGVVQSTVSASGTVKAASQSNANFKAPGQLAAVYVHVGEHVQEGRLLAELDPDAAQRSLAVAEDNRRAAEDRLAAASRESTSAENTSAAGTSPENTSAESPSAESPSTGSERPASAAKSKPTSTASQPKQSPEAKAANIAGDEAALESARANVTKAEEALADTRLYAPGDGTVASIAQEAPGANVSAGGSSGFIVLVDTSSMNLVVPMSESDITKVKVGQPATVTVNALPDEKLAAHVTGTALLSTTSSGVVSYDVTLKLDQTVSGLRPGMTASAQIVTEQVENAVNVTSSAISGRGGAQTVTVLRNGKHVQQPVIAGMVGDSTTQILSGVQPGEQVVITIATGSSLGAGTTGLGRTGFGAGALGGAGGLGGGGGVRFFGGGGAG